MKGNKTEVQIHFEVTNSNNVPALLEELFNVLNKEDVIIKGLVKEEIKEEVKGKKQIAREAKLVEDRQREQEHNKRVNKYLEQFKDNDIGLLLESARADDVADGKAKPSSIVEYESKKETFLRTLKTIEERQLSKPDNVISLSKLENKEVIEIFKGLEKAEQIKERYKQEQLRKQKELRVKAEKEAKERDEKWEKEWCELYLRDEI